MKEYKIERNPTNEMTLDEEIQYLNSMEAASWSLVTILDTLSIDFVSSVNHCYDYYFSREIEVSTKLREKQIFEKGGFKNDKDRPREATGGVREEGI